MSQKTGKRVSEPLSLRCRRDRVKVAQVAGVLSIFVPHTQKNAFLSDQAGREANCPVQAFWEEAARPYIPNHGSKAQAKSIVLTYKMNTSSTSLPSKDCTVPRLN